MLDRAPLIAGLVLAAGLGCGDSPAIQPPRELVGRWQFIPPDGQSKACAEATMEFHENGAFAVQSGAQRITGTYSIAGKPPRYLFVQHDLQFNGEPNCQGIPAEFVKSHYVYRAYVDIVSDTLRLYIHPTDASPTIVTVRAP